MAVSTPMPEHIAIDHPDTDHLTIFWSDGQECIYSLAHLRKNCPCATCKDLRQQLSEGGGLGLMDNASINPSTNISSINSVGRYAIQITWRDGHNTGIFTYEFLHNSCSES